MQDQEAILSMPQDQLEKDCIQKKSQTIEQGWWSTTTNWMKKKYFNGAHLIDLALNDQKSNDVSLFGMRLKSNEEARILYSSVLWFTYRQNLKFYHIKKEFTIKSDVGWGCMIRVGQMMMAHCLRLNLGSERFDDEKEILKVLKEFIYEDGKFSVEKIAQRSYQIFGLKPGDWYSPGQIAHTLCELQNENMQSTLKVIVYDNEFEWSRTLNFLDVNQAKNQKVNTKKTEVKNLLSNIKINPGLIIILFRIGYKEPQQQLLEIVINLLKHERHCIGILGGRPGKAHYLVGTTEKSFIYLDPHCVKDNNEIDSFFSQTMFSIPHENIDPSMGLCFYVRNTAQLLHLYLKFEEQQKKLPFYSYSKIEIPLIVEKQQPEQGFQKLQLQDLK